MQDAAIQRIDRRIDQEEVARQQYDREHAKSDAILNAKAAIAGYDGTPRDRSGKASGVVGTHDRGAMEKGLHKKSEKVKGAKTTKQAAKFTKELAAESRTDQTGGEGAGMEAANEAPSVEAPTTESVEAAPGPTGGGSTSGGSATATTTGSASGGGTSTVSNAITNAPPSIFSDAIDTAGKDLSEEGKKEAQAKKAALPEFKAKIEAPDATPPQTIDTAAGDKSLNPGGDGQDASAPTLTKAAPKKLKKKKPGQDMASAQAETPPDVLAHLFADSLAKIDTESTVNTNPGAAPTVKFAGGSDPARAGKETAEADTKITEAASKTAAAIAARPGTDEIQPIDVDQTVEPAEIPMPEVAEVPVDAGMAEYEAKMEEHGQAVGDAADDIQGAEFDAKLEEAQSAIDSAVSDRDTEYAAKVDESAKQVDELNQKAAEDQDKQVDDARDKVKKEHESTRKKQDKELSKAKGKSDKAKKESEKKIEARRKADDKTIQKKYKDADKKAKAEKKKAESKAEAEKKKAEAKKSDSGWFSSMASAISSFVDGIASAVTKVFDAMASAVAGILNAVKDAATSMIDAAINFATSTLDALGGLLKGLVDNLIGDIFPGLAAALNEAIDSAVNAAKEAVKAIGEQLKNGVAAAIDGLNSAVQAVMNAYKAAITSALAIASAVVSGDWEKALLVLLEGALSLAGIDKSQFYELVGQGTDTIKSIVDDPGSFIGNLIDAVGQGFGQFAGNFGTHLMNGAIDWLTGSLGEAGITLPQTWDAMGIFGLVMDVMGLSVDKLKDKVGKKIGEENMALLETAWGYVEAVIEGGLTGLWEHVQGQLSGLWDGLIEAALGFLTEKVVTAAVTKIASMFSPVGAIVQAILTAWNVYQFVQEQAQKIMALVTSVVSSMAQIVAGQLGPAAGMIEDSLAKLVPVAISLLANLLGLGGISKKVKEIVESLQEQVDKGIDMALDKLLELGKAAFDSFKDSGGSKPEGQEPSEMPDPAQLPSETIATTLGGMNLTFDAERGGQGATAQIDGKWSGKLAASAIPAMLTEAEKMEGPGKAEATGALGGARSQVASVDSQAGKFIRGEEEGLGSIESAFANLAAQILTAVNAIADETGGDKAASEANHEQMAGGVESAMEAGVSGSLTYEQWFDALKQRATAQEGANQGSLETDVKIDVDLAANVGAALSQGEFKIDIRIAPNDTTENTAVQLGSVDFDPQATLEHAGLDKDAVKNVYEPIAIMTGMSTSVMESHLADIWVRMMTTLNAEFPRLDASRVRGQNHRSGRSDLESKASQALIKDLNVIADDLQLFMRAQESLFGSNASWGFWSGHPAKDVAAKGADVTLEKSALGAIFEGYSKPLDIHYAELWSAVSRAYVRRAARDFKNRKFRAFAGNIQDRSVWNQVEQPLFQQLAEEASEAPDITFYACAGMPTGNGYYDADYTKSSGGCSGAFTSAAGLSAREPIQQKAADFFEAIIVGRDPEMAEIEDPLKPKKDSLRTNIEQMKTLDPTSNDWATFAGFAASKFDELCGPDKTLVTHGRTKRDLDEVADTAFARIRELDFADLTDPTALKNRATSYQEAVPRWKTLIGKMSNCNERQVQKFSSRVDSIEAGAQVAMDGLAIYDHGDRSARSWYAEKIPALYTARTSLWSLFRDDLSRDFRPLWDTIFAEAEEALRASEQYVALHKDTDNCTDNLWARSGVATLDHIKDERVGWLELARYTALGERGGRAVFANVLERIYQANEVLDIQGEFDDLYITLPPDVKEADLSKKKEVKGELEKLVKGHFGGWSRMIDNLVVDLKSEYRTRDELLAKIQEYVGGFLAGFGDASPGGLTQLYTRMLDQVIGDEDNPLAAGESEDKWIVTTAKAGRLGGIWTGFALGVPFVGPVLAGLGRFFASWASKGNKLRALYDAGAEWAFLQALQAGLFLLANPVAGAIVGLTGAVMASLGLIGGTVTRQLTDGGTDTVEKLEGFCTDIHEQDFKTPTIIADILAYLAQPDPEKTSS